MLQWSSSHTDDAEFNCAGTAALLARDGWDEALHAYKSQIDAENGKKYGYTFAEEFHLVVNR